MTINNYLYRFLATTFVLLLMGTTTSPQPNALPSAGYLDDSVFRDGLRERGLRNLLEQYLTEPPPLDEIDARLRQREKLLEDASGENLYAYQRELIVDKASAILTTLIEQ